MIWEQEQLKTLDPREPRGGPAKRVPQAHFSTGSHVFVLVTLKFLFRSRAVAVISLETQLEFLLKGQRTLGFMPVFSKQVHMQA